MGTRMTEGDWRKERVYKTEGRRGKAEEEDTGLVKQNVTVSVWMSHNVLRFLFGFKTAT